MHADGGMNYAFIDGQNLYKGIPWQIDYKRFLIYLRDKYKISKVYYFLGFREKENALYEKLQEAGYILMFNLKGEHLKSNKKGNIDTNLVFQAMKKLLEKDMNSLLLVSGDGDYKMLVDYLIHRNNFIKVLAPNLKYASSLYKYARNLDPKYFDFLDKTDLKKKFSYIKKAP